MMRPLALALAVVGLGAGCSQGDFDDVEPPLEIIIDGGAWQVGRFEEKGTACWRIVVGSQGGPCSGVEFAEGSWTTDTFDGLGGTYAYFVYGGLGASGRVFAEESDIALLLGSRLQYTFGAALVPEGEVWGLQILDVDGNLVAVESFVK